MTDTTLPMTRARWTALAVGVPLALAMIAVCARAWVFGAINGLANLSAHSYPVTFSAPVGAGGIHLTVTNGNLTFHTGPGHRIRGHGTLKSSLNRPAFTHRATAAGLTLNPTCRAPIGTCDASFTVTGPAGLPDDIDDSFGQLNTSGLSGDVTLTSNSGNITAAHLAGTVRLNDSFGDIGVTGVSGSLKVTSNSGNVTAAGVTGNTQISDSFGDVSVTGLAAADVHCTGQSGNITIVFATVPKDVQVNDSYGDVTLELPAGNTTYLVHTKNSFGSTSAPVPQSPAAQNTITVIDNSGNISIVNQDHGASSPAGPGTPAAP